VNFTFAFTTQYSLREREREGERERGGRERGGEREREIGRTTKQPYSLLPEAEARNTWSCTSTI
jgi:hypothetical protein